MVYMTWFLNIIVLLYKFANIFMIILLKKNSRLVIIIIFF